MNIPKDLHDRNDYPDMVRWFSPVVLGKTVKKVVASTLFGQYADRRLIQASLDKIEGEQGIRDLCSDGTQFPADDNGAIWVDYIADLGDGFDSTYAVAYLAGQKNLSVEGNVVLPRAHCLIMGGDEVYPDASRVDYRTRMQQPYRFAFPNSQAEGAVHPPVFLIPGNHDWYDGLTLFLALFCRGRPTSLGSWRAVQRRSYFAVQLPNNWWIWGYDSQLGEDIDQPQADFFVSVARQMKDNAKVILCASVPTWLKAELSTADPSKREAFYRGLDYIAGILKNECPRAKVPLVLSGDLHHYSRYVAEPAGTQFITAGGGGAFLHPTHHLPDFISARWVSAAQTLKLGRHKEAEQEADAVYPSRKRSRALAFGNLKFVGTNFEFCVTLGILYWLTALLLLAWGGYGETGGTDSYVARAGHIIGNMVSTPAILIATALYFLVLTNYADIQPRSRKYIVGTVHAVIHLAIAVVSAGLLSPGLAHLRTVLGGEIWYFLVFAVCMIATGVVGGFVWGLYLLAVSFFWGMHANDAFSAMRLNDYRNFLRLRICGDELTIYPIGLDKSPTRNAWAFNPNYEEGNQDTPVIIPKEPLGQRLIEQPIVIDASRIMPLASVAAKTVPAPLG